MGAEAIKRLLEEIDLDQVSEELKEELAGASGQKRVRILKRLEVIEAFRLSGNRPEWMILDVILSFRRISARWFSSTAAGSRLPT